MQNGTAIHTNLVLPQLNATKDLTAYRPKLDITSTIRRHPLINAP